MTDGTVPHPPTDDHAPASRAATRRRRLAAAGLVTVAAAVAVALAVRGGARGVVEGGLAAAG
ncbi:hypothetical protein MTQ07_12970, partial [Micromonospora sp. R42003]|nr:hypothetical protein [Micromonospora sp. R42003]